MSADTSREDDILTGSETSTTPSTSRRQGATWTLPTLGRTGYGHKLFSLLGGEKGATTAAKHIFNTFDGVVVGGSTPVDGSRDTNNQWHSVLPEGTIRIDMRGKKRGLTIQ